MNYKKAYPAMYYFDNPKGKDLDKWSKTAIKMEAFSRAYGANYTNSQVLYHFTKDWNMFERYEFKKWNRWNKTASDKNVKVAYKDTSLSQTRQTDFQKAKKKLKNRVNLVRKALDELLTSNLVEMSQYQKMFKILSMLDLEASHVKVPKLAAARVRRAATQVNKLGFKEGSVMLRAAATELLEPVQVKTAATPTADEANGLLRDIKKEMDLIAYSRHLDQLYNIKKKLEGMGRAGDAEAIEKIIRDDLSVLEKLNKKLVEVYSNLSKIPLELSEKEDNFDAGVPAKPREEKVPLEVKPKQKPLGQPTVTQKVPVPKQVAQPAATPAIQTQGVPNV